ELVGKFHKVYPEVTLELVEDVTDGITRRVEAGELDVALASTCQQSPSLRRESLGHEPLLALVPEADPLAKQTLVELDDFKAQRRQPSIARPQLYCQAMIRRQLTT